MICDGLNWIPPLFQASAAILCLPLPRPFQPGFSEPGEAGVTVINGLPEDISVTVKTRDASFGQLPRELGPEARS